MYFTQKKVSLTSFLFLYLFVVFTFSFMSYQFFITNFKELEEQKNQKNITILIEKISVDINSNENSKYWEKVIHTINTHNKLFKNVNFNIQSDIPNLSADDSYRKISPYNVVVKTTWEEESLNNEIDFYTSSNRYLFSIKPQNSMEILGSGKNTILLYDVAVSFLFLIIFLILRQVQNNLSDSNEKLEKLVKERTKKLKEYLDIVNKYVTTSSTDLDGNITNVSEAFCRISGYSKEELIGQTHKIVRHPDVDPSIFINLWDTITQDKKWVGEIKNKKKSGEEYWVLANIDPIYSKGKKIGYTSIRQEITDKKRVERLSVTDKLTQLYNRVRLEEIFTVEIAKFHRYNTSFSIILIDIDYFKDVNDTYGHNVGDSLLKEISMLLRTSVRIEDVVGRWGGEEFIILSNNYDLAGVLYLAEKIRKRIEEYDFNIVGKKTASFGIAILNKEDTQESLIYRADKSLYHAKKTGRNRVCLH